METPNACLQWARGVLDVVAGIGGQCRSKNKVVKVKWTKWTVTNPKSSEIDVKWQMFEISEQQGRGRLWVRSWVSAEANVKWSGEGNVTNWTNSDPRSEQQCWKWPKWPKWSKVTKCGIGDEKWLKGKNWSKLTWNEENWRHHDRNNNYSTPVCDRGAETVDGILGQCRSKREAKWRR
jgi:hypothetical protein